tara:strand:+ start:213 stop:458 length:246 start_codon:yes stop_codon:yes gene_type:complete
MSSELTKYIDTAISKKENLLNAEVLKFPKEITRSGTKNIDLKNQNFWKINDKSNDDQLKAVIGICFMIGSLIVIGLYSSFL